MNKNMFIILILKIYIFSSNEKYQFLPVSRFFVPNRNQQPFVVVFFEKLTAETYIHIYILIYQHPVFSNLSILIIHAFQ